jgi:hypothetical protein
MARFNINSYIISRNRSRTCRNTLATQFQDELDKAMYQQMAGEATEKIHLSPQRSTNVATLIEASR